MADGAAGQDFSVVAATIAEHTRTADAPTAPPP